jgi:acyl-coenzyme A thioesterase PaaI-like protein
MPGERDLSAKEDSPAWMICFDSVVYSGRTQAVCRGEIFVVRGEKEHLCAVAQGTIHKMEKD